MTILYNKKLSKLVIFIFPFLVILVLTFIKDIPKTINRMVYFKNTGFPKDILDRVYEMMHGLPEYQIRKIEGGIEITLNVPDYEK